MVVEAELGEDVLEKDVGDVRHRGSFVARVENYPLQKTMEICWKGREYLEELGDRGGWVRWVFTLLA